MQRSGTLVIAGFGSGRDCPKARPGRYRVRAILISVSVAPSLRCFGADAGNVSATHCPAHTARFLALLPRRLEVLPEVAIVPCLSQRCAPIIEPAMKLPLLVMNEVAISFDRRVRA
jgi:hypothetical protein